MSVILSAARFFDVATTNHVLVAPPAGAIAITPIFINCDLLIAAVGGGSLRAAFQDSAGQEVFQYAYGSAAAGSFLFNAPTIITFPSALILTKGRGLNLLATLVGAGTQVGFSYGVYGSTLPP